MEFKVRAKLGAVVEVKVTVMLPVTVVVLIGVAVETAVVRATERAGTAIGPFAAVWAIGVLLTVYDVPVDLLLNVLTAIICGVWNNIGADMLVDVNTDVPALHTIAFELDTSYP